MDIYNTTTDKIEILKILDRKTGIEFTSDLIGNMGDLHYNNEIGEYEMTQIDIDW